MFWQVRGEPKRLQMAYKISSMHRSLRILLALGLAILACAAPAQEFFKWSAEVAPKDTRAGESAQVVLTLDLQDGWHAYQIGQTGGPLGLGIELLDGPAEQQGDVLAPIPAKKFDKAFNVEVGYYEKQAKFAIPIRIDPANPSGSIKVRVKTQVCNASGCDRPREQVLEVPFKVAAGEARPDRLAAMTTLPEQPPQPGVDPAKADKPAESEGKTEEGGKSLWGIFVLGFAGGLLALVTPCVFPMIPVTISFFSKQGEDRRAHVRAALLYCVGIIVSFTGLGLLVTILLGKNGTYILANNIWVNLALFLLFVVLALSLFGVFELILPSGFLTKITGSTRRGGAVAAPLLMGLTFALTSFTCTVPVVGGLLAGAAAGDRLYPTVGMIGFSMALALPFLLLALFPTLLQALPKSGGWMVTAKAFMGFLELAAALKFLSNIDLVLKLGVLTQPVFLALWATIFIFAGVHLFGWIKLPHDSGAKVGPIRAAFGLLSIVGAGYCLAAMNGASLGTVGGLLPPPDYPYRTKTNSVAKAGEKPWILNDFPRALAESKATGKPILIDFTGYTCTNCRDMEINVFPLPDVQRELENYVLVKLYIEENDHADLQDRLIKVSTLPSYVVLEPGTDQLVEFVGYDANPSTRVPGFIEFLRRNSAAGRVSRR